jgi:hypothetical protein
MKGAQGKQGAAGALTKSQGGSSGPSGGQATGQRDPGTPEDVTFKRDHVRTNSLDPRGQPVGSMTADGPSPRGEATIRKGADLDRAVQELSEEVEKEPLPVEHRRQIQKFHELLLGGDEPAPPEDR